MSCCYRGGDDAVAVQCHAPKLTNKVIIVGNYGVGKTSLVHRYLHTTETLSSDDAVSFGYHEVTLDDVVCQIWDTAGAEKYGAMMPLCLRDADIVIVCFDLCDAAAVKSVLSWIDIVSTYSPTVKVMIAGTKSDLCGDVEGIIAATTAALCYPCTATSATTGDGVRELFEDVREHLMPIPS